MSQAPPTLQQISSTLPYFGKKEMLTSDRDQDTNAIIQAIKQAHKQHGQEYDGICERFWSGNAAQTAKKLFDFHKKYITYVVEPESNQTTKSPAALLNNRHGDCKHYSLFTCGVADALHRKGYPIAAQYRFVADTPDRDVHHVFSVIIDEKGNEIWCDPVLSTFNTKPKFFNEKTYAMGQIGAIYHLSGTDTEDKLRADLARKGYRLKHGYALEYRSRVSGTQIGNLMEQHLRTPQDVLIILAKYNMHPRHFNGDKQKMVNTLHQLLVKENKIPAVSGWLEPIYHNPSGYMPQALPYVAMGNSEDGAADGIGISFKKNPIKQFTQAVNKVKHGMEVNAANAKKIVLKVGLVPARKAFLALVALNVRSLATTLNRVKNSPKRDDLYRIWVKDFGGDWKTLDQAIYNGSHRKRLGYTMSALGVTQAAIAAWIALASSIIAALMPLLKNNGGFQAQDEQSLATMAKDGAASMTKSVYEEVQKMPNAPSKYQVQQAEMTALDPYMAPNPRGGQMQISPGVTADGMPQLTVHDVDHDGINAAVNPDNADGTPNTSRPNFFDTLRENQDLVLGGAAIIGVAMIGNSLLSRKGKK
jgi:hypothetical protein